MLPDAEILLKVQPPTLAEISTIKPVAVLIGFLNPTANAAGLEMLAARDIKAFAME